MTLSFLQQWHRYLILACEHPAPDEDVNELRRLRSKIARVIAYCSVARARSIDRLMCCSIG
jgi:hypothetical protein